MIRIKRVYEPAEAEDGVRVLVDRMWPRGIRKEELKLDSWQKDLAPGARLRKWFGHDPARWDEFKKEYFKELGNNPEALRQLVELAGGGNVTLLYSARNREFNNAVALREYLTAGFPVT